MLHPHHIVLIPYYQNTDGVFLYAKDPIGVLPESPEFVVDFVGWDGSNQPVRPRVPSTLCRYIGGGKTVQGRLVGGCTDVLMMFTVGTSLWPNLDDFNDAILFLENSEEQPSPDYMLYWLRNLGTQGILERIKGILFARPGNDRFKDLADRDSWLGSYPKFDEVILKVLKECGREDMLVVMNMDFGHTVPQLILPYGAMCEINPTAKTVSILEGAVR